MPGPDDIFKDIASKYADEDGRRLKDERAAIDAQADVSPVFHKRVRASVNALKARRLVVGAGALAACLLLLMLGLNTFSSVLSEPAATGAPAAEAPSVAAQPAGYEVIRLSLDRSNGFSLADIKQDMGKSIYYIADTLENDVVVTVEQTGPEAGSAGLAPVNIGGVTAYGYQSPDFSILAFEKDGLSYTLTCRYGADTLINLSKNMLTL